MIDPFEGFADSPSDPASSCFAIYPDDSAELPRATKALYIGEPGDVTLIAVDDDAAVTFANLTAGAILDVRVKAIMATGTTAAGLVGLA